MATKKTIKKTSSRVTKNNNKKNSDEIKIKSILNEQKDIKKKEMDAILSKEKIAVKVANENYESSQEAAIKNQLELDKIQDELNKTREIELNMEKDLQNLQDKFAASVRKAKESELNLINQSIKVSESESERIKKETDLKSKLIKDAEDDAIESRKESEKLYDKVSGRIIAQHRKKAVEMLSDELEEVMNRTKDVLVTREGVETEQAMKEQELKGLEEREAKAAAEASRAEASILEKNKDNPIAVDKMSKVMMGETRDRSLKWPLILSITFLFIIILIIIVILLATNII